MTKIAPIELSDDDSGDDSESVEDFMLDMNIRNHFLHEMSKGILNPIKNNPLPHSIRYSAENLRTTDPENPEEEGDKDEENLRKETAHLYKEFCECGKKRFLQRSKKYGHGDLDSFLNSSLATSSAASFVPSSATSSSKPFYNGDKVFTIILYVITIFAMIFLFLVRNLHPHHHDGHH